MANHKITEYARLLFLTTVTFLALSFPIQSEAFNALGVPFGGRITTPVLSGYFWGIPPVVIWCPSHVWILSFGPIKGPIAIFVPPTIPKAFYNYITSGVAVKGAYYPIPNLALCPFYPVYYASVQGTSVR